MAEIMGASEAHLSKVLQQLVRHGLLRSSRGPAGGFTLARKPENISLLSVWKVVAGEIKVRRCLLEEPVCDGNCVFGNLLEEFGERLRDHLEKTTFDRFLNPERGGSPY